MQQIRITIKSYNPTSLAIAMKHILNIAHVLNIKSIKKIDLPIKTKKFTFIRSPHIDKKSREQFQIQHHKSLLAFKIPDNNIFNPKNFLFFECIKNSKISGVELTLDTLSTCFYI